MQNPLVSPEELSINLLKLQGELIKTFYSSFERVWKLQFNLLLRKGSFDEQELST